MYIYILSFSLFIYIYIKFYVQYNNNFLTIYSTFCFLIFTNFNKKKKKKKIIRILNDGNF